MSACAHTCLSTRPRGRRPLSIPRFVARRTGPLEVLAGQRVLIVVDYQNLYFGALDLGCALQWDALARLLRTASPEARLHAVFARHEGVPIQCDSLAQQDWIQHAKIKRFVRRGGLVTIEANVDHYLASLVGSLVAASPPDVLVIGTGDGSLAEDVAQAVSELHAPPQVTTLSLAGSTATRLDARVSPLFVANIEIGRDALTPR